MSTAWLEPLQLGMVAALLLPILVACRNGDVWHRLGGCCA